MNINKKEKSDSLKNHDDFHSSYRRTNYVSKKKSIHCIYALEDILGSILGKHYIKLECYHTINVAILKIDSTSYRLTTPIYTEDIVRFINTGYDDKTPNKEKLMEHILYKTNLENIAKDHCLSCVKMNKCNAYNTYLTL